MSRNHGGSIACRINCCGVSNQACYLPHLQRGKPYYRYAADTRKPGPTNLANVTSLFYPDSSFAFSLPLRLGVPRGLPSWPAPLLSSSGQGYNLVDLHRWREAHRHDWPLDLGSRAVVGDCQGRAMRAQPGWDWQGHCLYLRGRSHCSPYGEPPGLDGPAASFRCVVVVAEHEGGGGLLAVVSGGRHGPLASSNSGT